MVEADRSDPVDFKWDKKKGVGGKNKEIQFYKSFILDGVHYSLYDSVYLYEEGEPEPHVGKLIKIWETADKTKKVKVLWFFRPKEIVNFLEAEVVPENELFLATGEGVGLANINPLEAIAGKCNIVCTSRDERNAQPSDEELQMADFVFYRTFNVRNYKVSDQIDEKVCGIEVKFIFNRMRSPIGGDVNKGEKKEGDTKPLTNANTKVCSTSSSLEDIKDKLIKERFKDASCKGEADLEISEKEKGDASLPDVSFGKELSLENSISKLNCAHDMASPISNGEVGDGVAKDVLCGIKHEPLRDAGDDSRQLKRPKLNAPDETSKEKEYNANSMGFVSNDKANISMQNVPPMKGKLKPKHRNESFEREKGGVNMKSNEKKMLSNVKSPKESLKGLALKDGNSNCQATQVTGHQKVNNHSWFKELPWEDRIESACKQGTLVLLRNLWPACTSMEVEDIVRHAFNEICSAKMIQHTAISSPHCGQAFVIFKTKDAARKAIERLEEGCLLLSNGRPLLGSIGNPCFLGKQSTFNGHIQLNNLRLPLSREMKEAVSTSHCSQPNTIEYEMALDWCMLQKRADHAWRKLYQNQGEELKKARASSKSK